MAEFGLLCPHTIRSMSETTPNNPFDLLGLEMRFQVDRAEIEAAYRRRLATAHPDAGGDGSDEAHAALLNASKETLLDDEQRAVTLLRLLGGPDAKQCPDLPEGFLMEVMELRSEIEDELATLGDEARERREDWAIEQRRLYRDRAGSLFDSLSPTPSESQLREIRVELNAWRYIERLIEQLDPEYDPSRADF